MEYTIEVKRTPKFCYINAMCETDGRIGKLGIEFTDDYPKYQKHCIGKKTAKIIYVITSLSHCGNGIATELLDTAIDFFGDEYNLYLNVIPMPRQGESLNHRDVKGLTKFYSKFGFEICESDVCTRTMIRKASLPTLGE